MAAEDILALTRSLKEAWLFGKLSTVGVSEAERRAERSRRRVGDCDVGGGDDGRAGRKGD